MAGKIVVSRTNEWMNRRRSYRVFIDEVEAGTVKSDSSEEFEVNAGRHTVQCKMDWYSSSAYEVQVADGKNSYVKVGTGLKLYVPLLILMLVGILLPMYFNLTKMPVPDWARTAKIALLAPGLLYLLFYMTVYRKKYLVVQEDANNPFK